MYFSRMNVNYSFIIPVYNRPEEVEELLKSFADFTTKIPFEVVLVEDGSTISSKPIVEKFVDRLDISYFEKENSGPGDSRNYGMRKAKGDFFIILDSDVILPKDYLNQVDDYLNHNNVDCFGGPDAAHQTFSSIQKAINFGMTSFLTTGGIRGKNKSVKEYEPRSFNMGISKKAFLATKGFGKIHPGEDPDLAIRIKNKGFKTGFIEKAFVYHKRRIDWNKFFIQVNKFGKVRPILTSWHPETSSIAFWFPICFIFSIFFATVFVLLSLYLPILLIFIYLFLIFFFSSIENKSIYIGFLSVMAVLIQFYGYGIGFLKSTYYIRLLKRNPKKVFPELFFE
ncbi:GT2 family glycosyltransferase [Mesonia algae]|uniref:GT2 family glycosyltransferase n=1 Tax=Mesonia algae TaxID=213248 RepID=A0A2W7I306_9FLAO|nr:glycosyltransferase family 2 protein [Mesonia algae]PZW40668.1 GT2 family glycosyltransferase [Mesonia algae]